MSGDWAKWELSSGSPGNMLWLDCTVRTGSFTHGNASDNLAGAVFTVQFGLIWGGFPAKGGGGLRQAISGDASPRLIGQTGVSVREPEHTSIRHDEPGPRRAGGRA